MLETKPLFIPLKTEPFEAFRCGEKTEELRRYGPCWNAHTCYPGRLVVLSKGYGKQSRLRGRVIAFKHQWGDTFGSRYKAAIKEHFGTLDLEIACIRIEIELSACRG